MKLLFFEPVLKEVRPPRAKQRQEEDDKVQESGSEGEDDVFFGNDFLSGVEEVFAECDSDYEHEAEEDELDKGGSANEAGEGRPRRADLPTLPTQGADAE